MRNICIACENCVYNSQSVEFCVKHECGMVINILKDLEYTRLCKSNSVSLYGSALKDAIIMQDCENCKKKNTCPDKEYVYGPECVMYVIDEGGTS